MSDAKATLRDNKVKTDLVRRVYHRWTAEEPHGYYVDQGGLDDKPSLQIGYAVLDTVNGLCDALDCAMNLLETAPRQYLKGSEVPKENGWSKAVATFLTNHHG